MPTYQYFDKKGNLTHSDSGASLPKYAPATVQPPQSPTNTLTQKANNSPAPAVVSSSKARSEVAKANQQFNAELQRTGVPVQNQQALNQPANTGKTTTQTTQGNQASSTNEQQSNTKIAKQPKSDLDRLITTMTDRYTDMTANLSAFQRQADSVRSKLNSANASLIEQIKNSFASQIEETRKVNEATLKGVTQAGIRAGRNRYQMETEDMTLANEMREGIGRIADLESKRDMLIAQTQLAQTQEDWKMFYQTWKEAQNMGAEMNKAVMDMYELRQENEKAARQALNDKLQNAKLLQDLDEKVVNSIGYLALNSISGEDPKADAETLKALAAQYDVDPNVLISKVSELQADSQSYSGEVGEYKFYADQARQMGQTPISFMDWKEQVRADSVQVIQDPLTGEYSRYNKTTDTISPIGGATAAGSFAPASGNPATRNNNPGNIKATSTTLGMFKDLGAVASSTVATDGGKFLKFPSPDEGFEAMKRLLKSHIYIKEDIDGAMRKWSNNGYNGDIAKEIGVPKTTKISELSNSQLDALTRVMARYEGFNSKTSTPATTTDPRDEYLLPYAQQYASTGQIPTGLPKGAFARVSQLAKELPKRPGTVIDVNTGVKPQDEKLVDATAALYDITKKIKEAQQLFKETVTGVIPGTVGAIFGAKDQSRYMNLRNEITDLLARARTGAAITANEERMYNKRMPGRFNNSFFIGQNGDIKLQSFEKAINDTLQSKLRAQGWKIVGYGLEEFDQ